MHAYNSRVINTPFCVALVDMSKRENAHYYLVWFERFKDLKTSTRISGAVAGSVNVLVSREETLRSCNVILFTGVGVEVFPNSADGLTLVETEALIKSTFRYTKNNDAFQAIEESVNPLLESTFTSGGRTRINAAGARLDIPGRNANYANGEGFAFYAPSPIFNNDNLDMELQITDDGGLQTLDADFVLHEYRAEYSSSPQGPFSACDFAVAACDGERPTHFLIGPDQYPNVVPSRPAMGGMSVSAMFPQPGIPAAGPAGRA